LSPSLLRKLDPHLVRSSRLTLPFCFAGRSAFARYEGAREAGLVGCATACFRLVPCPHAFACESSVLQPPCHHSACPPSPTGPSACHLKQQMAAAAAWSAHLAVLLAVNHIRAARARCRFATGPVSLLRGLIICPQAAVLPPTLTVHCWEQGGSALRTELVR